MFKITTKTGIPCYILVAGEKLTAEQITDDFAYLITKNGNFIKRKNFLYEGVFKVEADFLGEIETKTKLLINFKIPQNLFRSIEKFFAEIYELRKSEVAIILYFSPEKNLWGYAVPQQEVTASHVSYDMAKGATFVAENDLENGIEAIPADFVKVGSIHSHASMSAFHSGTDDKDEFGFDGIHITIGGFNKPMREYACRMIFDKNEIKKELSEVIDFPTITGTHPTKLKERVSERTYQVTPYFGGRGSFYDGDDYSEQWVNGTWRKPTGKKEDIAVNPAFNKGLVIGEV